MSIKQLVIPDIGTVHVYKRRGNRSLRLSLAANGDIRVSLPTWLPFKAAESFVRSKAGWIAANRQLSPVRILQHGQAVGKAHRLVFEQRADTGRITTRLSQNQIRVSYPYHQVLETPAVQQAAEAAAIRALRKEAETLLPQRLQTLAAQTSFHFASVQVKQLKSRWGSCSSAQEITLNLFLVQLPWHLIDYVLVHELVHTKVMRHGAPFWAEFERHVPNVQRLRTEIRDFQPVLKHQNRP